MIPDRTESLRERLWNDEAGDVGREWFTIVGGVGILVFLVLAVFGPMLAPYSVDATPGQPYEPPGENHLLGTDDLGHDIFSWLLVGARVSILVGLVVGLLAMFIATVVGVTAGLAGGRVETVLMRFVDVVLTLPFLPLIIVVAAVFDPGLWVTIGVLAAVMWARPARELRSEVLSIRNREYMEVSRSMGASVLYIATRYVVPGVLLIAIAQFGRVVSRAILLEAALSFLGLGDPSAPSWGTILYYAQRQGAFLTGAWKWWVIPPGVAITLSVLSFIFLMLGIERRMGPDRRSIAAEVPGADIDIVPTDRAASPAANGHPDGASDDRGVSTDGGASTDDITSKPDRDSGPTLGSVLEVSDLTVEYGDPGTVAVDDVDIELRRDELLGVVGESGSGKSSFALALLNLLREPGRVPEGQVALLTDGEYREDVELADIRGDEIAFVPQEAMNALDPRVKLEDQVIDAIEVHRDCSRSDAGARARERLESVGLPPESHDRYPFELSGGMCERGVVATALVNDPSVLVVDEPTTGLDTVTKLAMLELLEDLQIERELSIVLITHDLPAVARVADRIAVMHEGRFVEVGETERMLTSPDHPYTEELLSSRTTLPDPDEAAASTRAVDPLLAYENVEKTFGDERVLDGVDFAVPRGQSVALLGESGAGKSTMGRMAMGLERPDAGTVSVDGRDVGARRDSDRKGLGKEVHYLFQDPYSSLAPDRRVEAVVREPLDIHDMGEEDERARTVRQALAEVGLEPAEEYAARYPSELSGGERQRVAFARGLVFEPSVVVADEPTSMLDAPRQRELLELLYDLVGERGITLLHITHDVAQAATFADRIAVLHDGEIVEHETAASIISDPQHEQTLTLVEAAAALSSLERDADTSG